MERVKRRPDWRVGGLNREIEVFGPGAVSFDCSGMSGCGAIHVPFVKARRAIGFACRKAKAPLRRADRTVNCAIEFMMDSDEWDLRCLRLGWC